MISVCIATYGTDVWAELAERRAFPSAIRQDCEVIMEHQPDGTLASARNRAVERATNDWIVCCDADDELDDGYISAMTSAIKGNAAYFTEDEMYLPRTSFTKNGSRKPPHFFADCSLRDGNPMVIGTVVPRRWFLQVGGFTEGVELFEDWMLFAKLWQAGLSVVRVPAAIYVAYMVRGSRNRRTHGAARLYWHQHVGHAVFPEHYEQTTVDEDAARRLSSQRLRLTQ